MVTITLLNEGKCIWCCQQAEGVQAKFQDGLSGFLCKKHFWQALQVRAVSAENGTTSQAGETPASVRK